MDHFRPTESAKRDVVAALIASFANSGHIDLSKSHEEIWGQLRAAVKNLSEDFEPVIDHTDDLLLRARAARKAGESAIAVLMYATYIEHTLNLFLVQLASERGMLRSHYNAMLREASLRAKSTWLLPLLGARPLSALTVSRIQKLADARNAFIHYKWVQKYSAAKADQDKSLAEAEKLVKTLQRYRLRDAALVSHRSKVVQSLISK